MGWTGRYIHQAPAEVVETNVDKVRNGVLVGSTEAHMADKVQGDELNGGWRGVEVRIFI